MEQKPRVSITYCTQCRWLLRAAWLAQELLTTFEQELGEVALRPGTGGGFENQVGDDPEWARKQEGRFPEAKEVKQRGRDRVAPGGDLGHSEREASPTRLQQQTKIVCWMCHARYASNQR